MKLFIDSANIADIESALRSGCVRGITTNPSLLAKEPRANYIEHLKKIVRLASACETKPSLSVEVFSDDPDEIFSQAKQFVSELQYRDLAVKVHISHKDKHNLAVVKELTDQGIAVNCTACMTPLQAMMAAASGAKYVSLFYNRIRDGGQDEKFLSERQDMLTQKMIEEKDFDPNHVIKETRALLEDYPNAEIIVGSIRSVVDVKQAATSGAHIVTVSPKVLYSALSHFKTDEAVEQFFNDFASWVQ